MNMKKITLISGAILMFGLLAGCGLKGPEYMLTTYGQDPNFTVVGMKTVDPASDEFTFRYDVRKWTLEEWSEEQAPNKVALVSVNSDDKYKCVILPGTIGAGLGEGNQVIEGSLVSKNYVGRTIDVFNPIGVHLTHVVGFEVGNMPYIFEVQLPAKDPESCEIASQAVISTFNVANPTTLPVIDAVPVQEAGVSGGTGEIKIEKVE